MRLSTIRGVIFQSLTHGQVLQRLSDNRYYCSGGYWCQLLSQATAYDNILANCLQERFKLYGIITIKEKR